MQRKLLPNPNTGTLRRQLSQRVLILGLIAVVGLLVEIVVGLNSSIQGARRQLAGEADAAALAFTKSLGNLESDLEATSAALTYSTEMGQVLRSVLERRTSIFELLVVNPEGIVITNRRRTGDSADVVSQPWLETVRNGQTYIGPVDYGQFGVPFVDLAVAIYDQSGDFSGSLVARTDFTALWNPVTSLRIGESGYAYIVHEDGQILAYRDMQLVQENASLKQLTGQTPQTILDSALGFYKGIEGQYVLAVATEVSGMPWIVVVEQSATEALLTLGILSLALLVLLGVVVWQASSTIGFTSRRIVTPLDNLQTAVENLRKGNLDTRIEVQTEDELGNLASTFNAMSAQLQESLESLEQRVMERTSELEIANNESIKRAVRLRAIAEVGRAITSIQNSATLLQEITKQISTAFGFYHVGIFLIDPSNVYAVLVAANSPGGKRMLERGHRLRVGQVGIVGYVTGSGNPRVALSVGEDAVYFNNPDLPDTRSEIALPLKVGATIIGALDVQSTEANAFSEDDSETLGILADQVAVAIQNARLFEETSKGLAESEAIQRQYMRSSWKQLSQRRKYIGYQYSATGAAPLESPVSFPEIQKVESTGNPVAQVEREKLSSLAIPLRLRGETVGVLNVRIPDTHFWEEDEVDLVQAVADRVALAMENARLLEETTKRAERERTVSEITTKIRSTSDPESMLQTALNELKQVLGVSQVQILPYPTSQRSAGEQKQDGFER